MNHAHSLQDTWRRVQAMMSSHKPGWSKGLSVPYNCASLRHASLGGRLDRDGSSMLQCVTLLCYLTCTGELLQATDILAI